MSEVDVVIVGGPYDGKVVRLLGNFSTRIKVVEPSEVERVYRQEVDEIGTSVHVAHLPVRLTSRGYRAYWNERQPSGR